jgi:GntR family transcriptional regulator
VVSRLLGNRTEMRCTADVDVHTSTTKQRTIATQLRELVAPLRVGERLPAERDLAKRMGVARMTIRRAVDRLVADGVVERRHGSGTYVVPGPFVRALALTSFSHDMRERGLEPSSRLLSFSRMPADDAVAGQLRVAPGAQVFRFTRLRLADREPMALETVWIAASTVPALTGADLDDSLYDILFLRYGITVGSAKVTIAPVLPDQTTQRLLEIGSAQACLRLSMVDSDARGRVIMIANCIYRGDTYQLKADVIGSAFPATAGKRS